MAADDSGLVRVRRAFRAFDVDEDGIIEYRELARVLKALDPSRWTEEELKEFMDEADMNKDGIISYDEFLDWVNDAATAKATEAVDLGVTVISSCPEGMKACKYGSSCYNRHPRHLMSFWHPEKPDSEYRKRKACKYGSSCFRRGTAHLERFVHPGDRNYRKGLVYFGRHEEPAFDTLMQIFDYYDPDESGYMSKEEHQEAIGELVKKGFSGCDDVESAWTAAGGEASGYINFARFSTWAESIGVDLPVGLAIGTDRPCHFRMMVKDGWSCPCANFEEGEDGFLCTCGHKPSLHRAGLELKEAEDLLDNCLHWKEGFTGLVLDDSPELLEKVQALLDHTHKKENNWTRDRGCKIHGRGHADCSFHCIRKNGHPVPTGYRVKMVLRNQNMDLWKNFSIMRSGITLECQRKCTAEYKHIAVESMFDLDSPLKKEAVNEWRLFHGTSYAACQGICNSNFRLSLSGTGATWKDPGADKGSPLYGYGIYLAERITKADEYAGEVPDDDPHGGAGLNCALICRAVGGRANVCMTNEIDKEQLKKDVFDGPYHSVFGDRVTTLNKPFKEIVMYDKDQIYPEFCIYYERRFD